MASRIASLDALKALETKINSDVKHINGILKILSLLKAPDDNSKTESTLHLAAIHSLRRLFTSLAQRGDLQKPKPQSYKRAKKGSTRRGRAAASAL